MNKEEVKILFPGIDPATVEFLPMLEQFHEGVLLTDSKGMVLYMNSLQETIDDLVLEDIKGKNVREVYRVDENFSPVSMCINTGEKVDSIACFYRTRTGKVVNSIHNVIPLYAGKELIGTLCFVRAYSVLEKELESFTGHKKINYLQQDNWAVPNPRRLKNGTNYTFSDIIGESTAFQRAIKAARLSSDSPSPVMLYGETGTGKELVAQAIHNRSRRHEKQFVALNCAAIPENLLEGILFGTTKGAFTGATDRAGLFEKASGGTLFLDEINSMSLGVQAKLLRVLQERKVRRVGSLDEISLDLKIVSSVNEDPHQATRNKTFRSDLLYRLGVVFIRIPALNERKDDLDSLIRHFILKYNRLMGKRVKTLSPEVTMLFHNYNWPGNVRELEHIIEGAMNLVENHTAIEKRHLSIHIGSLSSTYSEKTDDRPGNSILTVSKSLTGAGLNSEVNQAVDPSSPPSVLSDNRHDYEIRVITELLTQTQGNVAKAARRLKISPQLLHYKLKKYEIAASNFKPLFDIKESSPKK